MRKEDLGFKQTTSFCILALSHYPLPTTHYLFKGMRNDLQSYRPRVLNDNLNSLPLPT